MKRILVTCVGSGVGQSAIDSLNLTSNYYVIGCDGNPNVYAHTFCNEFIIVPNLNSDEYLDVILNICAEKEVDLVIPGHDHELVIFGKNIKKFRERGINVIVSDSDIIAISRDKKIWFDYFSKLGVNIVPTMFVKDFRNNPNMDYIPAIVKPAGGSASQGISIINNLEELNGLNDEDIIQPYLFPDQDDKNYKQIYDAVLNGKFLQLSEISIQLIFTEASEFVNIFISKNSLKNGVPVFVDPINPKSFKYIEEIMKFVPILTSSGAKGPVNIQGRITPKGLFFFEMNMRFTGITGNRALLGFNEVDFLVKNFLKEDSILSGYAYNKVGVRQVACSTIKRQINFIKKATVTIIGGGSNIGKKYIKCYSKNYDEIFILFRETSRNRYFEEFENIENVKLISINDSRISEVLCQSDLLLNFASALAFEQDSKKFETIRFLHSIIIKAAKANIPKIINISSQSVYPQDKNIIKLESNEVKFENSYSFQKIFIEDLFNSITESSPNSQVVNLRLPRVIIPSIKGQAGFFGKIIDVYKEGGEIAIEFPNSNTNLIHISDVLSSIKFIENEMNNKNITGVFNVSGSNISMLEYIDQVKRSVSGKGFIILGDNINVKNSSMIDGSKLNNLGWKNELSYIDIINELAE